MPDLPGSSPELDKAVIDDVRLSSINSPTHSKDAALNFCHR
jgi:hypothetical protein